ncbi:MAG: hypothetical protein NVSMB22_18390 [Chloroflexota bacterium]
MIRRFLVMLLALALAYTAFVPRAMSAALPSGQTAFGQGTVEPAYDDSTGNLVFLLTPNHAPFPSESNPRASAPLYIPMYPQSSTVSAFNCLPTNCDHLNVVPSGLVTSFGLQSVYPTGTITTKYGTFTGGLYKGHDHLVGVASTGGDFNIAWHVYLLLFTAHGVADGAANHEITTLPQIQAAIGAGDVVGPIDSGIVFNCSVVSEATYLRGS